MAWGSPEQNSPGGQAQGPRGHFKTAGVTDAFKRALLPRTHSDPWRDADLGSMTPSPLDLIRFLLIPRSTESRDASQRTRQLQTPVTPAAPRKRLPVPPQRPGPASRSCLSLSVLGVPLVSRPWQLHVGCLGLGFPACMPERPPSEGAQGGVHGPDLGPGNFFCFSVSLYFSYCLPVSLSDRLSLSLTVSLCLSPFVLFLSFHCLCLSPISLPQCLPLSPTVCLTGRLGSLSDLPRTSAPTPRPPVRAG